MRVCHLVLGLFGAHGEKSFPLDEAAERNGHKDQPSKSLLTRQAWQLMKVLPIALARESSYAQGKTQASIALDLGELAEQAALTAQLQTALGLRILSWKRAVFVITLVAKDQS